MPSATCSAIISVPAYFRVAVAFLALLMMLGIMSCQASAGGKKIKPRRAGL